MKLGNLLLVVLPSILPAMLFADSVQVEPSTTLQKDIASRIIMRLDQPAESAAIEFKKGEQDFFINQNKRLELTASENPRLFTALITPENFFAPALASGQKEFNGKNLELTGIVRRLGKEETFFAGSPWEKLQMPVVLQKANQVLSGYGKFCQAACFDGRRSIAAVNRLPFNPSEGSLEAWVMLPPLLSKQSAIIAFLQSADGSPWRYHALQIPQNSRRIQYLNYHASGSPAFQAISSQEIYLEEWIFVSISWSLSLQRMELLINGESVGVAPYLQASGGRVADLNLGARIHYENMNYRVISPCMMMIDELRISKVVRPAIVPDKKWEIDEDTLLLIDFDGGEFMAK